MTRRHLSIATLVIAGVVALAPLTPEAQDAGVGADELKPLIRRAKVWVATDVPAMDLRRGPAGPGAFDPGATVTCTYSNKKLNGASPKFACLLPNGDELKVKYDSTNGEVYGEIAASRLLWALGFGADHMYAVRVVCRGCPPHVGVVERANGDRIVDPATVERKFPGRELASEWKWQDLDLVDERDGGASVAERDALKLLGVLIQHSDSKADNHRIVCAGVRDEENDCAIPLMMIHDVGVTLGRANAVGQHPRASMNLNEWSRVPVWKDPQKCIGNISGSWRGSLNDPVISEAGRKFLADLLSQLSTQQIRDMFDAARVHLRPRVPGSGRSGFPTSDEWAAVFNQKRAQIVDRRCAA
jgi:hypothetical protein